VADCYNEEGFKYELKLTELYGRLISNDYVDDCYESDAKSAKSFGITRG
jgi:hypothetical protein